MTLHIFSYDPGLTTGHAHISIHDGQIGHFSGGQLGHNDIGDMLRHSSTLQDYSHNEEMRASHEFVFVCEQYEINPVTAKEAYNPIETTGLVKYWAHVYGVPVHMAKTSAVKPLIKDSVVKRAGLWVPGQGHEMDAVRVALWYLITRKGLLEECLIPSELSLVPTGKESI